MKNKEEKRESVKAAMAAREALKTQIQEALTPIRLEIDRRRRQAGMSQAEYCRRVGIVAQVYERLTTSGDEAKMGPDIARLAHPFGKVVVRYEFTPYQEIQDEDRVSTLHAAQVSAEAS